MNFLFGSSSSSADSSSSSSTAAATTGGTAPISTVSSSSSASDASRIVRYKLGKEQEIALEKPGSRLHIKVPVPVKIAVGTASKSEQGESSEDVKEEIVEGKRNRYISIINHRGSLYAFDSTCYHAGGPLGLGDIEDHPAVSEPCITCPWHSYTISLIDGGKLYQGLKMDTATKKMVPTGWQKKTNAQRVHKIEKNVSGDDSGIVLTINDAGEFDSDEYASNICGEQCAKGDKSQLSKGKDGVAFKRSGHVLSQSSSTT